MRAACEVGLKLCDKRFVDLFRLPLQAFSWRSNQKDQPTSKTFRPRHTLPKRSRAHPAISGDVFAPRMDEHNSFVELAKAHVGIHPALGDV